MQGLTGTSAYNLRNVHFVYMQEGMKGLFRGYYISAFCTPFFHTIYFPLYESIKLECQRRFQWEEGSFYLYSLSASIAGMTCNVITNPFWMVRTRMQAEIFRSSCEENYKQRYPTNMFRAMLQIAQEEGVIALYQGLSASVIGVLHPLIYFPLYEKSKLYFQKNWSKDPKNLESRFVFVSAICCKAITSLLTYPHEVVRAR